MEEIRLKPIGLVKKNVKKFRFGNFEEEISEIIVDKKLTEALNGIEDYSHVIIVYWQPEKISKLLISLLSIITKRIIITLN